MEVGAQSSAFCEGFPNVSRKAASWVMSYPLAACKAGGSGAVGGCRQGNAYHEGPLSSSL